MIIPAFQLTLNNTILPGLVTVGKYDGIHPSLTCATTAGKLFVHSPHQKKEHEVRFLNINQKISAIAAGQLLLNERDVLLVGTQTNLLAYDVEQNAEVFYKDIPDGVNVITVGKFGTSTSPLALVGGNCSIQAFNGEGNEELWTVTGDNVSTLMLSDIDGDGRNEMVVGSDDYEIRVFKGEEVMNEATETDKISALCRITGDSRYGYALANGTIGVYNKYHRVWRTKTKHTVTAISSFDLDNDGVPELVSGWSNGRLEVRSINDGQIIYKDMFESPVAAFVTADYRQGGKDQLICCSLDGTVRGYLPTEAEKQGSLMDKNILEQTLISINQKKQEMLQELKLYEDSMKQIKGDGQPTSSSGGIGALAGTLAGVVGSVTGGGGSGATATAGANAGSGSVSAIPPLNTGSGIGGLGMGPSATGAAMQLPADLKVLCRLEATTKTGTPAVELSIQASVDSVLIRTVALFAEQVFEDESFVVHPNQPTSSIRIPLVLKKHISANILVKVLVSQRGSSQCQVFELVQKLPKFASFVQAPFDKKSDPVSSCVFTISERANRVAMWFNHCFIIDIPLTSNSLDVFFACADEKGGPLRITATPTSPCEISIKTNDMDLAGELIADLCEFLGMTELESNANFPIAMEQFSHTLTKVDDYNAVRLKLTAEMADSSTLIKTLVIKAEDSRILGDMKTMKKLYTNLYEINRDLITEYKKRENNHQGLLDNLKQVNQMVQRAANLRVGAPKARIIAACRGAIKANNIQSLFKIIKVGKP